MSTLGIVLSLAGGACELGGLGLVGKDVKAARARAREVASQTAVAATAKALGQLGARRHTVNPGPAREVSYGREHDGYRIELIERR